MEFYKLFWPWTYIKSNLCYARIIWVYENKKWKRQQVLITKDPIYHTKWILSTPNRNYGCCYDEKCAMLSFNKLSKINLSKGFKNDEF